MNIGEQLSVWTIVPFVLMLGSVALLPVIAGHWYHRNLNKGVVSAVLGVPVVVYVLVAFGHAGGESVAYSAEEYVSFILLLLALYTISGGIYLTGNLVATPMVNLAFLAGGALLANLIGTMGASMLLIRPLLRANSERTHNRHTLIFFIFAVSNIGGMLTPLGDPPLYLGFLEGVPFSWELTLWPHWLTGLGLVLIIYILLELRFFRREPAVALYCDECDYVPMRVKGGINFVFLALVIVTILLSDIFERAESVIRFPFLTEIALAVLTVASLLLGPRGARKGNSFTWVPIVEVAVVFAGIFATMIPALALLEAYGKDIGVTQPWQYFWATGWLSAFLDNAPTYLSFASIAEGQVGLGSVGDLTSTALIPGASFSPAALLTAISCGAVMMGALTYIGNAPNFAVRGIAIEAGVKMPSFFGYMKYSLAVLLPVFAVVTVIFFI